MKVYRNFQDYTGTSNGITIHLTDDELDKYMGAWPIAHTVISGLNRAITRAYGGKDSPYKHHKPANLPTQDVTKVESDELT